MVGWNNRVGCVYFIRNDNTGLIKVGFTTRMRNRMFALKSLVQAPITVLGFSEGWIRERRLLEKRIHGLLNESGVGHEWFRPSPLLDRLIEACATPPVCDPNGGELEVVLFLLGRPRHSQAPLGLASSGNWVVSGRAA